MVLCMKMYAHWVRKHRGTTKKSSNTQRKERSLPIVLLSKEIYWSKCEELSGFLLSRSLQRKNAKIELQPPFVRIQESLLLIVAFVLGQRDWHHHHHIITVAGRFLLISLVLWTTGNVRIENYSLNVEQERAKGVRRVNKVENRHTILLLFVLLHFEDFSGWCAGSMIVFFYFFFLWNKNQHNNRKPAKA